MEEARIIPLKPQPREMQVVISPGMDPLPTPVKNDVQRLIEQMREQGKSDERIKKYFSRTYKVDLEYV